MFLDNDGDLDIYLAGGQAFDNLRLFLPTSAFAQMPPLYHNDGRRFRDITAQSGPALQLERACGGFAVANRGQALVPLRNQTPRRSGLAIRWKVRHCNVFGLGVRFEIEAGGAEPVREINTAASCLDSNVRSHVGLGASEVIDRLTITSPGSVKQAPANVVNQISTVEEP